MSNNNTEEQQVPGSASPTLTGKKQNRSQPEWIKPSEKQVKPLMINNSLTTSKVPFVPLNPDGKTVTWYTCGPTVYDASHMGHARNYITFDVLRRVMRDYFGYNVQYIMNITDIDDKIIIRSREKGITHTELSRHWESEFFKDMKALNVLPPDALTRVTEYVPQIVDYVQKIIDNGYAYESQGSVYFDTQAYQKDHFYGKLEPNSVGDAKLQADGEGALSILSDKRHPSDFALWKRSKEGEPTWDSKWGAGRPGWHIECSAMASDILGQQIDIHSGGEDLKFPHHDNELAQSEAYYNNKQWINYFIHSGHLHINGQKMAKSLKNFTTIQDALSKYSARQIRILFLMHKYDKTLSYSPESMQNAGEMEKTFTEFFHKVKSLIRENPINLPQFWTQDEKDLNEMLQKTKAVVHDALLDNFDTREVFLALAALVNNTNAYIAKKLQESNARVAVIQTIAEYITFIFNTFGLVDGQTTIGFGMEGGSSVEDSLKPILDALVKFRASVRSNAITKDTTAILKTCDELRDEILPLLGVRLDDKAASSNGGAVWKFENVETLKKEMELKKEIEANKLAKKLEQQKKEQEKFELSKVPPQQLFVQQKDKFSQFDDKGIPTHDATGKEISASQKKKLVKEYEEQNKNHQKYLATLEKTK